MKDYFNKLKGKIKKKAPPGLDDRFWVKFEREFHNSDVSWLELAKDFLFGHLRVLIPVGAIALVFIIYMNIPDLTLQPEMNETQALNDVLEKREILEHMDLLIEVDSANLSEKEWNILLTGKI